MANTPDYHTQTFTSCMVATPNSLTATRLFVADTFVWTMQPTEASEEKNYIRLEEHRNFVALKATQSAKTAAAAAFQTKAWSEAALRSWIHYHSPSKLYYYTI